MGYTIEEMKQWVLANAMQSKHPEIGEQIVSALNKLQLFEKVVDLSSMDNDIIPSGRVFNHTDGDGSKRKS